VSRRKNRSTSSIYRHEAQVQDAELRRLRVGIRILSFRPPCSLFVCQFRVGWRVVVRGDVHLFSTVDQTLLRWGNAFFFFDLSLDFFDLRLRLSLAVRRVWVDSIDDGGE
jgi:hypothetical protein